VQEARAAHGIGRDDATPKTLLQLARDWAPDAELVEPEMTDGDGIFFDGRLWQHGNRNRSGACPRLTSTSISPQAPCWCRRLARPIAIEWESRGRP
jgi:hypothetical protein